MAETPKLPFARTMRFADENSDVLVTVTIESEREGMRASAIRSAMVNHVHLYPIEWTKLRPLRSALPDYLFGIGVGMIPVIIAFGLIALFLLYNQPPQAMQNEALKTAFILTPAVVIPFVTLLSIMITWQHRNFKAKSRRVAEKFGSAP